MTLQCLTLQSFGQFYICGLAAYKRADIPEKDAAGWVMPLPTKPMKTIILVCFYWPFIGHTRLFIIHDYWLFMRPRMAHNTPGSSAQNVFFSEASGLF